MADQLLSNDGFVPASYIRPESRRPRLHAVIRDATIPTVDPGSPDKPRIIFAIPAADYGFLQMVNHYGLLFGLVQQKMEVQKKLFMLPPEEKEKHYSDDPVKKIQLSTSVNIRKETVSNPPSINEVIQQCLAEALAEQDLLMDVSYYPKWPAPNRTYGLPGHTDPNALTILLQDQTVAGLQVRKDGGWTMAELVGEGSPAMYRNYTYNEDSKIWSRNLDDEHCLELHLKSLGLRLKEHYMAEALGEQEHHMGVNYYTKCPAPNLTNGLQVHTDPNAVHLHCNHLGEFVPFWPSNPPSFKCCFSRAGMRYLRNYPSCEKLNAMAAEQGGQQVAIDPLMLNTICTAASANSQLMHVEIKLNNQSIVAMVDTGASHFFVSERTAIMLNLKTLPAQDRLKTVNAPAERIRGISPDVHVELGLWEGKHDVRVVAIDDYEVILGLDFLEKAKVVVIPHLRGLQVMDEKFPCFVPCVNGTQNTPAESSRKRRRN